MNTLLVTIQTLTISIRGNTTFNSVNADASASHFFLAKTPRRKVQTKNFQFQQQVDP